MSGSADRDRDADRDGIEAYLRDFEAHLRARGLRRRRIVGEVRGHLAQGLRSAQQDRGRAGGAAEEAIARFGSARSIAGEFNALPRRPRIVARRLVILWTAWIAAMAMGSATVWAAVDWPATDARAGASAKAPPRPGDGAGWPPAACAVALRSRSLRCP